jgi:anti-sigma factor RsiW
MSNDVNARAAPAGAPATPDPDACIGVVELVTEYLEDALAPDVRARFEAHLAGCDGCDIYLEQMRATIEAAGDVNLERVPPATLDRLIAAYRATRSA